MKSARVDSLRPGSRGKPVFWQLVRLLVASSRNQAFLNRSWIPWLVAAAPRSSRRPLALRLLALSPHYFLDQWSDRYPSKMTRSQVLEAEFERNRLSRRQIFDQLLQKNLHPAMTVLDFGCGPGFLSRAVSEAVARVVAVDVSRGAIACARAINPAPNITYRVNRRADLRVVEDASIDLAFSFAVFQHLDRSQAFRFLHEFARVLKPGGLALCQFAIRDSGARGNGAFPAEQLSFVDQYRLRMSYMTTPEVEQLLRAASFTEFTIAPISAIGHIEDDIGMQHLASFRQRGPRGN
jgi:ubiquinone/menaquinone biosynthesis C-methylase UbiE